MTTLNYVFLCVSFTKHENISTKRFADKFPEEKKLLGSRSRYIPIIEAITGEN